METTPKTDVREFDKFIKCLPEDFKPHLFPLVQNGKEPIPFKSWKNNKISVNEAHRLMRCGFNIGIAGTPDDKLCIVDVDDLTLVPNVKPTLQVTSRKRIGRHNFFFATDGTAKENIATDDAGEVRSNWQYVVAAGSYVPCSPEEIARIPEEDQVNAGRYTVSREVPISEITFEELLDVYKIAYRERENAILLEKINPKPVKQDPDGNNKNQSALWKLTITDIFGYYHDQSVRFPMPDAIHGSETGGNASFSSGGELLTCWWHEVSLNALAYLAICAGLGTCNSVGAPFGGGCIHVNMKDPKTVFTVWQAAKRRGLIPKNDPFPSSAVRNYYAIKKGFCKQSEIIDGWKLPANAYVKVNAEILLER